MRLPRRMLIVAACACLSFGCDDSEGTSTCPNCDAGDGGVDEDVARLDSDVGDESGGLGSTLAVALGGTQLEVAEAAVRRGSDLLVLGEVADPETEILRSLWLVELGSDGQPMRSFVYDGGVTSRAGGLTLTTGGVLISGSTQVPDRGDDMWVLKLDTLGAPVWQTAIGGVNTDGVSGIAEAANGDILLTGYSFHFNASIADIAVVRLASDGSLLWSRVIGGEFYESLYGDRIALAGDNDVWLLASGQVIGWSDIILVKLDGDGNVLWHKSYGGNGMDHASAFAQTPIGDHVIAGASNSFGASTDDWDGVVMKVDAEGEVVWSRLYGAAGSEDAWDIIGTSDGGFLVAGTTDSAGAGGIDAWVLKLDDSGNIEWQRVYGGSGDDEAKAALERDGGFVVAGSTASFGGGNSDVWVLMLDATGNLAGDCPAGLIGSADVIVQTDLTLEAHDETMDVASDVLTQQVTEISPTEYAATTDVQCASSGD